MQDLYDLLRNVFAPEDDWSHFLRKVLGLCVAASLGAAGWSLLYLPYTTRHEVTGETPVSIVVEQYPAKEQAVRHILQLIMQLDPNIRSVWLYSWPAARQLSPVMYVGENKPPLPGGAFLPGDETAVGNFVFGHCEEIPRQYSNHTCPISGDYDTWGIVSVRYGEDNKPVPDSVKKLIDALVHRIGLILYTDDITLEELYGSSRGAYRSHDF